MDPSTPDPWLIHLAGLGVATASGLVVGLERERSGAEADRHPFAGVRTLALAGLTGGVAGLLGSVWGVVLPLVVVAGITVAIVLAGRAQPVQGGHTGVTTEISALLVTVLGVLSTTPLPGVPPGARLGLVGAAALVGMGMLTLRAPLHKLARTLSPDELVQVAQLGLLLLVALPVLPNRDLGPLPGVNPFEIGLMVTLIATISFAGYLAVRWLGPGRGLAWSGLLGGLVSSTAVTLGLSSQVRERPELARSAGLGIILACAIMLPRQLLELAVVSPTLLRHAALPLGVMGGLGGLATLLALRHRGNGTPPETDRLQNPGSMRAALQFGALYVVIRVVAEQATEWLGPSGLYVSALLAGIADVDAITLSIGRLAADGLDPTVATRALILATCVNTGVKAGLVFGVGGRRLGLTVLAGLGPMVAIGLAWAALGL